MNESLHEKMLMTIIEYITTKATSLDLQTALPIMSMRRQVTITGKSGSCGRCGRAYLLHDKVDLLRADDFILPPANISPTAIAHLAADGSGTARMTSVLYCDPAFMSILDDFLERIANG